MNHKSASSLVLQIGRNLRSIQSQAVDGDVRTGKAAAEDEGTHEHKGHLSWPEDVQTHRVVHFGVELVYGLSQLSHFLKHGERSASLRHGERRIRTLS